MLHPAVKALLAGASERPAFADLGAVAVRQMQAGLRPAFGAGPPVASVSDLNVPTRAGSIPARLFEPEGAAGDLIVHLHGGGWVLGEIEDFDPVARVLAVESGCRVLLPAYRLAPEHPFPAALEDAIDTIEWAHVALCDAEDHSAKLCLVGDSAGANLACAAARRLRGEQVIDRMALFYPVADSTMTQASYAAYGEDYLLRAADMAWFFDQYAPGDARSHSDITLLADRDFSGLPPTLVVTAQFDVLADEGRELAAALRAADVATQHRHAADLAHGFVRWHNFVDTAREELRVAAKWMAAAV